MNEHHSDSNINPIPTESADDMVLRMFKGASFGPGFSLVLPSGKELGGDEAQAFTAAFADDESLDTYADREDEKKTSLEQGPISAREMGYDDDPLSSRFDQWTGDPETDRAMLIVRAIDAINRPSTSIEQVTAQTVEDATDKTSRKISVIKRLFNRMIR